MSHAAIRVLWVEVDRQIFNQISPFIQENQTIELLPAANPQQAARQYAQPGAGISLAVMVEASDAQASSLQPLETLHSLAPDLLVLWVGREGGVHRQEALLAGAVCALSEPLDAQELSMTILAAHRQHRLSLERAALFEVANSISSAGDLLEILRSTCQAVVKLFGVAHSGLVHFDPDLKAGQVIAEFSENDRIQLSGQQIAVAGNLVEQQLLDSQKPVVIEDVAARTDLGELREVWLQHGIQSLLIVPVIANGQVIASFSLDSVGRARHFSEAEQNLCMTLAGQAAIAISNRQHTAALEEAQQRFETLVTSLNRLLAVESPEILLQKVVDQARAEMQAWGAVIWLPESQAPSPTAGFDGQVEAVKLLLNEWGRSLDLSSCQETPLLWQERSRFSLGLQAMGVQAAAQLPFAPGGAGQGVLGLFFLEPREFSEIEQKFLTLLTAQAAQAYEKIWRLGIVTNFQRVMEQFSQAKTGDVLQQVAIQARALFSARYALLWPYDLAHEDFMPDWLVGDGLSATYLERFSLWRPEKNQLTWKILESETGDFEVCDPAALERAGLDERTAGLLRTLEVQALQVVRLGSREKPFGVLYLAYTYPRAFRAEEKELLTRFANLAAVSLKRDRSLQLAQKSWDAAEDLAQVAAQGNLEDTLETVLGNLILHLDADLATVYVYSEAERAFTSYNGKGNPRIKGSMLHPKEIGSNSSLYRLLNLPDRDHAYTSDADQDPLFNGEFVKQEKIKACFGQKLIYNNKPVGVMFVDFLTHHRFQRSEIKAFLQYGRQAASAIYTAQVHEQASRRAAALQSFFASSRQGEASHNLGKALMDLANQALSAVGPPTNKQGSYCHITLLEEDGRHYRFVAAAPPETLKNLQELGSIDIYSQACGIVGRVIREGKPLQIQDVNQDPNYLVCLPGIQAELSVPLLSHGRVIGGLSVEHPDTNAFGSEDLSFLSAWAERVAAEVDAAREHTPLASQTRFFVEIVKTFQQRFACDLVCMYPYDAARREFGYPAYYAGAYLQSEGRDPARWINLNRRINVDGLKSDSVLRRVMEANRPVFAVDSQGDKALKGEFVSRQAIVSSAGVPILAEGQVVGIIFLNHRSPHDFDQQERDEIDAFARLAGLALAESGRFNALMEVKGAVGGWMAQAWMSLLGNYWSSRLEDSTRDIAAGLARVSRAIQDSTQGAAPRELGERLEKLKKQVESLTDELSSPSSTSREPDEVWVNDLIRECVDDLSYQEKENPIFHNVSYTFESSLEELWTHSYPEWVRFALEHWIVSVLREMDGGAQKRITFAAENVGSGIQVCIVDNAPLLPTDQLDNPWNVTAARLDGRVISLSVVQALAAQFGGVASWRPLPDGQGNLLLLLLPKSG